MLLHCRAVRSRPTTAAGYDADNNLKTQTSLARECQHWKRIWKSSTSLDVAGSMLVLRLRPHLRSINERLTTRTKDSTSLRNSRNEMAFWMCVSHFGLLRRSATSLTICLIWVSMFSQCSHRYDGTRAFTKR